ncbi:probable indole-3-acetic acid-amido synthetase GH3.6 [Aristolochia californica]|uniref:probable indole-3-acetic acid-amido synthetase GH3.6 n=1 Tax=Aristolochia californica TaxID=171875 RepID=UPI0035E31DA1
MADEEILRQLEESTRDARRVQRQTLAAILARNSGVSYLQPYLLNDADPPMDPESFRRLVPISSYDDYADYIQRLADGDTSSFLSVDPLLCFFSSSGTSTVRPKMIPYFDSKESKSASILVHQASAVILRRLFPPRPAITKILWFIYAGQVTRTKGGLKVMAATAYPMQNNGPNATRIFSLCVSPPQILKSTEVHQQMYCHLLCGLRNYSSIDAIRAPYALGLIRAFSLLESKWEQLCKDIECGSVSPEITDPALRDSMQEFLDGPQYEIALRIQAICEGSNWGGIFSKLWPNLRYVSCVLTGSMQQYYPKLRYYAGDVPLLGGDYFASECAIAINLDRLKPPKTTRFVMIPNSAYFEFLPFDLATQEVGKETADISSVEVGKIYEVVVTTYRGLFRYRLGDVVKVVGFYNAAPEIEFVTRIPKGAHEYATEREVMLAVENLQAKLKDRTGVDIIEFTSCWEIESTTKHLVIFVELNWVCESVVLQGLCASVESFLGDLYKAKRTDGKLGPLKISVVRTGSFDVLEKVALDDGAPASQYKLPKVLRSDKLTSILKDSVILTVSSD